MLTDDMTLAYSHTERLQCTVIQMGLKAETCILKIIHVYDSPDSYREHLEKQKK